MEAQEALNKLCRHLLGGDWYIVDPVGVEQGNDIIVDQIMKRYPAVDETPVDKWRRKHKRCKWCIHHKPYTVFNPNSQSFETCYECKAKDVSPINIDIPRPFCTLFNLKKENQDEHSND